MIVQTEHEFWEPKMHATTTRPSADAWSNRERSRFVSTTPAAYLKLSRGDGPNQPARLPTSLLLNI